MTPRQGNMWDAYAEADRFVVTTNAVISQNGELVMGRGAALEAKTRFPHLPAKAAALIKEKASWQFKDDPKCLPVYGFLEIPNSKLGIFQVKYHFQEPANLELIRISTAMLALYAERHDDEKIVLNAPGDKLSRSEVWPIVETLPDNVEVWTYGEQQGAANDAY